MKKKLYQNSEHSLWSTTDQDAGGDETPLSSENGSNPIAGQKDRNRAQPSNYRCSESD